jgi:hypothetical protein
MNRKPVSVWVTTLACTPNASATSTNWLIISGLPQSGYFHYTNQKGNSMSDVNQAFNDFLVRVDEYLADRDFDGDEINDFIVEHNDELINGFNAGKSVHDTIADIDVPARS